MSRQFLTKSPIINVMAQAALKAARSLVKDFGEVEKLQISKKGPADFVSQADKKAERILYEELSKTRPTAGFLLEENGEIKGSDPDQRFIIDPLDGTTNFLHGIPHFAISIGYEKQGKLTAGVVYDPIKDELFWSETGGGAFVNGQRLRVSNRKNLGDALILAEPGRPGFPQYETYFKQYTKAAQLTAGVRCFGSAALNLAYVAAGRGDAYFEYDLKPWDVAAGIVIVKEAGGYITAISPGDAPETGTSILATNLDLYEQVKGLLHV